MQFGPAGLLWRLLWRTKSRLYPFALLLTVIALLLAGVSLTVTGMATALTTSAARLGADLMVLPAGTEAPLNATLVGGLPLRRLLPAGVEGRIAPLPGVRRIAPQYFLASAESTCCEAGNLLLVGFDPARDFTVLPWLVPRAEPLREDGTLLVGGGIMKAKGAEFRLYNRTFRVASRLERSGIGYFDNAVFIPLTGVVAMEQAARRGTTPLLVSWDRPSLLLVQLAPGTDPRAVAADVEGLVPGVRVMAIPELFHKERLKLERIAAARAPLLVVAWLLALIMGGAVQLLYWRGHRQTLGLLQVWGYGRRILLFMLAGETLLLTLLAMAGGSLAMGLMLQQGAGYLASGFGLPLLLTAGTSAAAGLPGLCLSFGAVMAGETLIIILWLLQSEPAALLRRT